MRSLKVIILGAGLSGCVSALLLAKKGCQVSIISRDAGTSFHLPETWIYDSNLISFLSKKEALAPALSKQTRCSFMSADGMQAVDISTRKEGKEVFDGDLVWVDRNKFDRVFLDEALKAGIKFFSKRNIVNCELSEEVKVTCQSQDQIEHFSSDFIIDATGKTAFLSQLLKLPIEEKKLDSRVACFSHFELESSLDEFRIISIPSGYIFCIPTSGNRVSIGCVIKEGSQKSSQSLDELFQSNVAQSAFISNLIKNSKKMLPTISIKNHQRICLEPSGEKFRLVGDAAAFLDPFFCPGIDFAFFSAIQAVRSIEQDSASSYKSEILSWLKSDKRDVYQKLEQSDWLKMMHLFADPHLPFVIPLMFTQAFTQVVGKDVSLKQGMQIARNSYEMAAC